MLGDPQPDVFFAVQAEVFTIEAQDLRMNIRRQSDVHGVDVGDKAHARRAGRVAPSDGGDGGVLVNHYLVQAQLRQLIGQQPGHLVLAGRGGQRRCRSVALAGDRQIAEEALG